MTESQSPQEGNFAASGTSGRPAGTGPYAETSDGPYASSPDVSGPYTSTAPEVAESETPGTGSTQTGGKVDTAKQEASGVAGAAGQAAQGVVETARTEAAGVAQEVKVNARELYHQTRSELYDQAQTQQTRVADGLRTLSDELRTMASNTDSQGVAADIVQQAAERSSSLADWLGNRDPGSLLDEVKSFARRRPGAFLLLAAGAGVVAGRLGRGLAAGTEMGGGTQTPAGGRYSRPPAPITETGRPGEFGIEGIDPDMASGEYRPGAGTAVPPPPVQVPGPGVTTAGMAQPSEPTKVQGDPFDGYDGGTAPDQGVPGGGTR